jgi:[ribosomal protein S5]-alanine N-acetyltransferase
LGAVAFGISTGALVALKIGYDLSSAHWGRGFMSEGVPPILGYGFSKLGLHRIKACPFDNVASNRLLLRLGFKYEGNLRQRYSFRDRYADQLWYGLLEEEWENHSRR